MSEFTCHNDLSALWGGRGGLSCFARDMEVPVQRAWKWQQQDQGRGFIPPWHWTRLIEMLERRHGVIITYRQLTQMTEHRRRPAKKWGAESTCVSDA